MGIEVIGAGPAPSKEKKVDTFTSTGSWTAPAGVTYAIAYITSGGGGGGGGNGGAAPGSSGGESSALGKTLNGGRGGNGGFSSQGSPSGLANTGQGGTCGGMYTSNSVPGGFGAQSTTQRFGVAVTPGTEYPVVIGAGGAGGSNGGKSGGSGLVAIEYWVEI